MGDIVSLVERAAETIEKEDAEKLAARVRKGQFDMNDLLSQLRQLRKMGGLSGLMGMLPGALQAKAAMSKAKIDEKQFVRWRVNAYRSGVEFLKSALNKKTG